jgi:uncharacterized protein (TIGR02001 family)
MERDRGDCSNRVWIGVVAASMWLATDGGVLAQQRPADETPRRNIILGSRGLAGEAQGTTANSADKSGFELSSSAGFATDYVYRGVTLSDRKPALGASFEAAFDKLYASLTMASVKLPTEPSSEISFAAGLRPKLGNIELDLAWTYYAYPNESWWLLGPTGGTDYWEASLRAATQVTNALRIGGGFAWSPNVSNTGAPGQYYAAGMSFDLPRNMLPNEIGASLSGSVGYSRFGNMDAVLGGFPLPAYTNWNAGATFTYKTVIFDLRYYDTTLSEENCYVFTGATDAVAGGAIDPLRNPEGLRSRWCGATFVAKLVLSTN